MNNLLPVIIIWYRLPEVMIMGVWYLYKSCKLINWMHSKPVMVNFDRVPPRVGLKMSGYGNVLNKINK